MARAQPLEEVEGEERGDYRERGKEGPKEQEGTHYSAICAAEKHKDISRKA